MKNIFTKFSIENFWVNINKSFKRFPLSFISSVVIFFILEYLIYNSEVLTQYNINIIWKSILSLVTVYFFSIWIYLFTEKLNFSRLKICITQLLSIIFWIAFYFSFEQNLFNNFYFEVIIYIVVTYIWVISFVFVTSFIKNLIKKDVDNDIYYTFFNSLTSKIVMSLIVWFSLMLLWFIALASIFALFDLNQYFKEDNLYWYWATFSLSLFAPIYFLIIAPEKELDFALLEKIKLNKFYNFLSNYIALPFIIIYFFILYAYSIKVLLNFSTWPEWIISWMVILFSLFWYLIYIFSYTFEEKSSIVRVFRKIFPFAVLFQTPMLFYAIYLRINQYDLTINRYLVVVFWIFLLFISLYYIFSKKKYLLYIPLLLTFFIMVISIWPWGVYSFPESRQLELLKQSLKTANILQWNQVVLLKKENDIEPKLSGKIYDKISYLCDFHGCDSMWKVFWNILEEIKNQDKVDWEKSHSGQLASLNENINSYTWSDENIIKQYEKEKKDLEKQIYIWISSWNYKTIIIEKLKIKPYYNESDFKNQKYIIFNLDYNNVNKITNVSSYDYLLILNAYIFEDKHKWESWNFSKDLYFAEIDNYTEKLIIKKSWIFYEEFNLSNEYKDFFEAHKTDIDSYWNSQIDEPLVIVKEWKNIDVKLILDNFSLKNYEYSWLVDNNNNSYYIVSWKLLLKEKNK